MAVSPPPLHLRDRLRSMFLTFRRVIRQPWRRARPCPMNQPLRMLLRFSSASRIVHSSTSAFRSRDDTRNNALELTGDSADVERYLGVLTSEPTHLGATIGIVDEFGGCCHESC